MTCHGEVDGQRRRKPSLFLLEKRKFDNISSWGAQISRVYNNKQKETFFFEGREVEIERRDLLFEGREVDKNGVIAVCRYGVSRSYEKAEGK